MNKVIVFDGGNYLHKAIFAFRNNYNVPATYTYMRMLIGDLKKVKFESSDQVIIAQDSGRSWRKEEDPNYKAQRKAAREGQESPEWWKEMYGEFNDFIPKLEMSLPWHFIGVYHCEADDVASVVARYYKSKEVILCSSDRDWEMLLAFPNVKLFSPISKKFKNVPNPMKVLLEKIQGDVSDNLLEKPSSEAEFERRKRIVNLLELPDFVEQQIQDKLHHLLPKNLYLKKIPYNSIREEIRKLYIDLTR